MAIITWTCVEICFIFDSCLLCLASFSYSISQHLIQQRLAYVFLMLFSLFLSRKSFIFLMVSRYIQQQIQACIFIIYQLTISFILTQVLLKYELCSLTSSFPPHHHSLLILYFICCHSTPLLFLQSLQLHLTYLHYYVNRYILKQSVFISQLNCTRASFFSPGPSDSQIYLFIYLESLCFYLIKSLSKL